LYNFYAHTGRRIEWKRLVEEIVPDFVDPATDSPLPGREKHWSWITDYRILLAHEAQQWSEAERLQRVDVEWHRKRAAAALTPPVAVATLDDSQRRAISSLAISLERWGSTQRGQGKPDCVAAYKEAISLCERINDKSEEANLADNLGAAYMELSALRDMAQAEHWFRHSLELRNEGDRLQRARTLGSLGMVALSRFAETGGLLATAPARIAAAELGSDHISIEARDANELLHHFKAALGFCHQALDLLPENAVYDLATVHSHLGTIYGQIGNLDRALPHWRESIQYFEIAGDLYKAGTIRYQVAISLFMTIRRQSDWADAAEYARAALHNFETYGQAAAVKIQETKELLKWIEQGLAAK
jgi:tetratricopeptide (TPR) repeat protein